jgi:hypothetical protein
VHAYPLDACRLACGLDDTQQIPRVHRPVELGGEDQSGVSPLVAGPQSLRLAVVRTMTEKGGA